ncbi:uncharacterized protein EV154DRAFT_487268 [Mucor mucedo]|uniref:uncharacterized protein n=1 Tax=Mucor mucedo TaxID=29922 RepID=UPI00221FDB80|nr:uncharacterized protein EV154DRAFT_487268 [Mucor mucedo]KAI7873342.1 hypothetical protein EV154DRAFT_487268 [Mucor mucedo]
MPIVIPSFTILTFESKQRARYHLPKEIMELIIGHLDKDNDIKNCRLVCSNWNSNVYSICFNCGIKVALGSASRCEKLMKDLVEFPQMAAKIRKLCLSYIDEDPIDPDMFVSVLDQCTYIENLEFRIKNTGPQYLLALFDKTPHISRMKEITVEDVDLCSRSIRRSHLLINFIYRNTITVLELSTVKDEEDAQVFPHWQKYISSTDTAHLGLSTTIDFFGDGFHKMTNFASKFPKLKVLKLVPGLLCDEIDLTAIMETNICKLKTLHIFGSHLRLIISAPRSHWPEVNLCNSVTDLDVRTRMICARGLECIMTFTNLVKLAIHVDFHLTDYRNSSFNDTESHLLINQFTSFCNRIKIVDVHLVYESFTANHKVITRQIVSQNGRLIDMEHKSTVCCSELKYFYYLYEVDLARGYNTIDEYDSFL